jgi:hypothetical protein
MTFAAALSAMAAAVDATLGRVLVTYSRGEATVDLYITPCQTAAWAASLDDGLTTRVVKTQALLTPADLDLGDGPTEPEPGDRITHTSATTTRTWEVRPPTAGRPAHEWIDPYQTRLRVALVLVEVSTA